MSTRRTIRAPVTLRLAFAMLLALASWGVHAQSGPIATQNLFFNQASGVHQGNYLEGQTGLIYTDNANLEPNGSSDTLAMIGLVGDISRTGAPRLDYHLDSDLSLVKYLSNSYDTQPFGYADGDAELKLVPGLFSWVARASFTQAILDPSSPATPTNLESLTYLTTGPKFTFRPTLRTTVTIGGVYSYIVTSSKSPLYVDIDSQRLGADVKVSRAFTNTFSMYVAASFDRVRFVDEVLNTNFDQKQASLGLTYGNARTEIDASGGYTKLELYPDPSQAAEVTDTSPAGSTYLVNFSHLISQRQRLTLHVSKQVTDAANLFQFNLDQPVPVTQQNRFATGEPFTHREYGGSWRIEAPRTTLEISALASTDRYELAPASDRDANSLNAFVTRQLNRAFILELGLAYERDKYPSYGDFTTTTAITTLRWRVGPRLAVRFIYAYTGLSSNISANQIGATLTYALTQGSQAPDTLMTPMTPNAQAAQPPLLQ